MFLIGVRILSGTVRRAQAGDAFARLADVADPRRCIARSARISRRPTAACAGERDRGARHGQARRREMTATSDLDLILVYDFDAEAPESDGARPLYGAQYFARLTQRLISALSAPTNDGRALPGRHAPAPVRPRPGRSRPASRRFAAYQENEAWTWEHMALTRARVVSASPGFERARREVIRDVLARPRDAATARRRRRRDARGDRQGKGRRRALGPQIRRRRADRYRVHRAISAARARRTDMPGHSRHHDRARARQGAGGSACCRSEDAEVLRPAVRLYQDLTQILRLCLSGPFDPKTAGAGLLRLLARAADVPDFATLDAHHQRNAGQGAREFRANFGRMQPDDAGGADPAYARLRAGGRMAPSRQGGSPMKKQFGMATRHARGGCRSGRYRARRSGARAGQAQACDRAEGRLGQSGADVGHDGRNLSKTRHRAGEFRHPRCGRNPAGGDFRQRRYRHRRRHPGRDARLRQGRADQGAGGRLHRCRRHLLVRADRLADQERRGHHRQAHDRLFHQRFDLRQCRARADRPLQAQGASRRRPAARRRHWSRPCPGRSTSAGRWRRSG